MKKIIFLFAPLCAMLMVGCAKDEPEYEDFFELFAEGYTPDNSAKLAVRDARTYWVNGERLWINGGMYRIEITNSNGSEAKAVGETNRQFRPGYICAIYPFSAYVGPTVGSGTNTRIHKVRVPESYDYQESGSASGSKQILDGLPMVAYGATTTERNVLQPDGTTANFNNQVKDRALTFKHITAAITVRVKNPYQSTGGSIIVGKIELSNDQYMLCGDVNVEFSDGDPVIKTTGDVSIPCTSSVESNKKVTLNFPTGSRIFGQHKDFQIPILPVGPEDSKFTVKVYYKAADGNGVVYKCPPYEKTQTTAGDKHIDRACLGYAMTQISSDVEKQDLFSNIIEDTSITVNGRTVSGRYYGIASVEDVMVLSEALDDADNPWIGTDNIPLQQSNYLVLNDIDMGGETMVPIHYYNLNGTSTCCFDGQGYTISNFTANSVSQNEPNSCGFFGRSGGSHIIIANLNIKNATYEFAHVGKDGQLLVSTDNNPCSAVGGIYAVIDDEDIIIDNCTVTDIKMGSINNTRSSTTQTDFYASGIVGLATRGVTIRNCKVGKATVDNTQDAESGKLVDQFGGAIGRIDIQGHPSDVITIENFTYDQSAMLAGTPAVFTTGQNTSPLTFANNLLNVRYGGVIANITRGCTLYMKNCYVKHNAVLNTKKSNDGGKAAYLYLGGLIGSMKSSEKDMYAYMDANCEVHGTIKNNSLSAYTAKKYEINKYISGDQRSHFKQSAEAGSVDALEASHMTLSVTTSAGKLTTFSEPSQTLFSTGTKSDSPTPKKRE